MLCRIDFIALLFAITSFQSISTSGVFEIGFLSYILDYDSPQPAPVQRPTTPERDPRVNVTSASVNVTKPYQPWTKPAQCSAPPRYRFHVCIESRSPNTTCDLGHENVPLTPIATNGRSALATGSHMIQFTNKPLRVSPSLLPNPIHYRFKSWVGSLVLNVYVECCGTTDDIQKRCKEKLSINVTATPFVGVKPPHYSRVVVRGRASLVLMLSLYCLPHFYGPKCETFCQITDRKHNKVCHPQTGELVCRPGLTGERCDQDEDECKKGICHNGGTCVNYPGSFRCFCESGVTTGRFCEFIIPSCPSKPCKNGGTCEELNPNFKCHCTREWHGPTCEERVDDTAKIHVADSLKLRSSKKAKSVSHGKHRDNSEAKKHLYLWYIGVGLVVLTVVVTVILILCVIWTSKRRRYKVPSQTAPSIVSISTQPAGSFDNSVYLRDPEILQLQPNFPPSTTSSSHYQRTFVTDREYSNVRPLYEDHILPDCAAESHKNGYGSTKERSGGGEHHLLESRRESEASNLYVEWNNSVASKETDNPYEEIDIKGLSSAGVPWSDSSQSTGDIRGIEYRKTSDVTGEHVIGTENADGMETPSWLDDKHKRKQSTTAISGGLANWPSETNKRKKKAGYDLKSAW